MEGTEAMNAKFPRIPHLPFSPGATPDDERVPDLRDFLGHPVVLTEKIDGSNVCLTSETVYARSHSGAATGRMFDELKAHHAAVRHLIPEGWSIFAEWCAAVHTVEYQDREECPFPRLFVIGARDDEGGVWGSWETLYQWAGRLGCHAAPKIHVDVFDVEARLRKTVEIHAKAPSFWGPRREGVVVRVLDAFKDDVFGMCVAKYVNAGFKAGEQLGAGNLVWQPGRIHG